MKQVISKTAFGIVFKCTQCDKIHIEFNNINLNFTEKGYREFLGYLNGLDGKYWESKNKNSVFHRKIRIPFDGIPVCLLLNDEELHALRELLSHAFFPAKEHLLLQFNKIQFFN